MDRLNDYINEAIDVENLFWKIDTWFKGKDEERNSFSELVNHYKGKKTNPTDLEKYLVDKNHPHNTEFIDFLNDELPSDKESRDYIYLLSKVIDIINANKLNKI